MSEDMLEQENAAEEGVDAAATGPPQGMSLIERLFQLRRSGSDAIVSEAEYTELQARMHVPDEIEDWVYEQISNWRDGGRETSLLVMLSGNAGDGKSDLIARLRKRLGDSSDLDIVADATHADTPAEDQIGRLIEFFRPFGDGESPPGERKAALIAMNTGMALSFLQQAEERGSEITFRALGAAIRAELGLSFEPGITVPWTFHIVNLDRRSVLPLHREPSLFDGMVERLNPDNENGLLWESGKRCEGCTARAACFVRTNIEMLRLEDVKARLSQALWAASLSGELHLTPRSLWDLLYQVTTGGAQFFSSADGQRFNSPCDAIEALAQDPVGSAPIIQQRLLYNLLYEAPDATERGSVLGALAETDPVLRLGKHGHALEGSTFNDPWSDQRAMQTAAEAVGETAAADGMPDPCLAALADALDRPEWDDAARYAFARGAVRRSKIVGIPGQVADELVDEDVEEFEALLSAYRGWTPGIAPPDEVKEFGRSLVTAINRIFGIELLGQSYFQQDSFSPSTSFPVFAQVDLQSAIEPVVDPDIARGPAWLDRLSYRPAAVVVEIRTGGETPWRIRAGLNLYRLVRRVLSGYSASSVDLEAFFGLRYACERLGSASLDSRDIMIRNTASGTLYRLHETTEFGELTLAFEET
jgi:hypothetical protein